MGNLSRSGKPLIMTKNRGKIAVLITVFFVILSYQWFITAGKTVAKWPMSRSSFYYDLQSRAFMSRQLHLLDRPRPELLALSDPYNPVLNRGLVRMNDLTLYNGKYYINWGPVPALIVSLVHFIFTSTPIYDSFIVFSFLYGSLIFNTLLILWLRQHVFTNLAWWVVILAIILISLVHPIPWLLGRPAIYEASITGGQFFLISGLYWGISSLENSRPNLWRLFLAGISWALVIGTRISLLIAVLFSAVIIIYIMFRKAQKNGWSNTYLLATGCIIGPLLLIFLLLGFYNYSRFGSFFETGVQYTLTGGLNQHLLAQEGKLVSREYVFPNLMNYMTNGVGLQPVFPYLVALRGNWSPKQIPSFRLEVLSGILWVLPFALFSLFPIIKFLGFIFQKIISQNRDLLELIRSDAGLLRTYIPFIFGGGALFAFLPLLTFFGATMRYQEDFVPLLMLLSIWGFWSSLEKYHQRPRVQRSIMIVGVILSFISIIIAVLLGITSYNRHFEIRNPELLNRIRNSLAVKVPVFLTYDYEDSSYYKQADLIWQSNDIFLWKWNDEFRVYLIGIKNPNGEDILKDGKRFYWLGGGPSNFELIASRNGLVQLSLDTIPGPSLPSVQERHLKIVLPDGRKEFQTVLPGIITFNIPVIPGKNTVVIEVLDMPSLHTLPNGDIRPLLLGIQGIDIQWSK